jgi:hypothetical protein
LLSDYPKKKKIIPVHKFGFSLPKIIICFTYLVFFLFSIFFFFYTQWNFYFMVLFFSLKKLFWEVVAVGSGP